MIRVLLALVAVAIALLFGARLIDHERCESARRVVYGVALGASPSAVPGAVDRVRRSCRGTDALVASANALDRSGRFDAQALALAREATEREPGNARTWSVLAVVARDQAPDEARAAERRLAGLDPLRVRRSPSLNRSTGRSTR